MSAGELRPGRAVDTPAGRGRILSWDRERGQWSVMVAGATYWFSGHALLPVKRGVMS